MVLIGQNMVNVGQLYVDFCPMVGYAMSNQQTKFSQKMTNITPKFNLKKLPFSPTINPLAEGFSMTTKRKRVQTGGVQRLADSHGEIHDAVIVEEEELDDLHFVKVFTAGIRAAFGLTLTGSRVFQAILDVYQKEPMSGGFVDSIYLHFFDGGLSGSKIDLSDRTFRRGLHELLERGFIYPRGESLYWVNPNLFFRGNRATFIKSYRRKSTNDEQRRREELEARGQQRLAE
jgi:hypothetical protein